MGGKWRRKILVEEDLVNVIVQILEEEWNRWGELTTSEIEMTIKDPTYVDDKNLMHELLA